MLHWVLPSDLRRASRRFFSSSSLDERIDLTAGTKADCARSVLEHLIHVAEMRTLRRFPLLSFRAGSSNAPRLPGPMLLLRVFLAGFDTFFGDWAGVLRDAPAKRPSAMFSLPWSPAMMCCACACACAGRVVVVLKHS
jgi:hypothetical protein